MITTVKMRDDVTKAMRMYMAQTGRGFREQSDVINELILAGIEHLEEDKATEGHPNQSDSTSF